MTVRELIKELIELKPDEEVRMQSICGECFKVWHDGIKAIGHRDNSRNKVRYVVLFLNPTDSIQVDS